MTQPGIKMSIYCLKGCLPLVILMKLKLLVGILHINLWKHLSNTWTVKYLINQIKENVHFLSSWS